MNNDIDFSTDAGKFIKSQLPTDFEEKALEFAKKKQYQKNDYRLFQSEVIRQIDFQLSIIYLKDFYQDNPKSK